ncbi:multi-sensor signal transduction histidine kinase [Haloterrigena turkmenica DSM 5511]|uniref:histidine kinase n=1 Tax=Haloterrigena turkmenica (strain ATCC 51198 / DSM 5511 / JCM 9101 / NCIMB 13204 / VKM B-1734 / 4k) TaxID=543526 RepID=D2RVQ3_HALTV|nr:PAS domain S-box protein [Haloterrigena turkmenica]ADB59417.1 multi-sensor signal transduction histidine kinase [Haloterrigena turkmenica DSM 5511]
MGSSSTDADHRAQLHRQEVVADLSQQALETGDLDGVLADAALAITETLDIEYCSVFELRPDRTAAVLRAGAGWPTDRLGSTTVSVERTSWTGDAVREAEPVVADDLDAESRFSIPEALTDRDVASGVAVRIGPAEQPWGVLGAYATESHAFLEADVDFLERVADVLGSAVEHARTRRDLERTERRFEAIFEDPNILVGLLDPDGTVRDINGTAMEYIDADLEDVTGELFWETPWWGEGSDARDDVKRWTERAAAGEYVEFEADLTRPDGEWYTLNGAFRPVTNEEGEVVSVIVSDRDVTERKARERELEESEQRYRTLVDHFPNGAVALVDEDLTYRTVGGSPTDTADATADEIEGEPVAEAVPPSLADELVPRYEAALEGESTAFETTVNGRVYDFQLVPVRDDDGEVFAALGMSQDVTERRKRERQLEESEQRYRTLMEYFPNGIVTLFDLDLRYELAAGRGFDRIPVDPADFEGSHVREVWDDEAADTLQPVFEAALDGEEQSVELEYNDRVWIVRVVPITDERGDVFAGMTMAQDITERKRHEQYLRETTAQLEAATEAGAVGTWEWRVPEDEIVAGETFAETFDVDPQAAREGVSSERFLESIHEDDRARVEAKIEAAFESCGEYEAEYRVRTADGDLRWVVARGHVECDEDGDPVRFPGALTDITERKHAELELQRNNEQLETLFDVLPVGVVVADADGRIRQANDTAREIWGGDVFNTDTVAEYERYPVWSADSGERISPEEMTLARVLDGEEVTEPDIYEIEADDGERRIVRVEGMPVRNERGEVARGVVTLTDITDRRESQRRLEESEQRYRTLIDHFPNGGVGLFDENLEYQITGGEAFDEIGASADDIVGQTLWERYPSEMAERLEPKFRAALEGEVSSFEMAFHDRDWMAYTVPVMDDDDEIFGGMVMVQEITERKERERKLRERERRLEQYKEYIDEILDAIDDVFYVIGEDGSLQRWNRSVTDVTGYSDEEIAAMEPTDLFIDDDVEDALAAIRAGFETGSVNVELTVRTNDGDAVPFEFNASRLEDPWGNTVLAGIGRDITDRLEREKHLERYETIVETVNDGVYVVDEDGRFTMVNETYASMVGYEPDELVGEHVSMVVDDDVSAQVPKLMAEQTDRPTLEATVRTADGDRIPAEATFAMLPEDDSRWHRVGVVRDISERKERERRLEESERRYRTLVENFPGGAVGLYDEDLEYIVVGGEAFDDLGIEEDEVAGATVDERFSDELVAEIRPYFRAVFEGESNTFEYQAHGRDVWAHTLPLRNEDDEIFAGMVMAQDVTERKEYQRKLEESNERLERFAYAASHDLQEPLRMVTSYLTLLENRYADAFDEDGREFLEFAVDGADRMREMIDGLLEYSRVETRGDPFEPMDLDDIVDDVLEDLQFRIEETDAELTVEDLPRVEGDASQLRQVFQNLLSNALTYSGDEPPRIHVGAERRDDEWVISVADEGIGIDPEDQDRVFTIFDRLHSRSEYDGTGIGLALCERIVERHGGEIWVDSEPGEGSTFSVALPASRDS